MNKNELYQIARSKLNYRTLGIQGECGQVACALETIGGNIYTGINIDIPCSIGFCAEQAAMADMLKNNETKIKQIIAVYKNGNILPPCGRCREFIYQIDHENLNTIIVLPDFQESSLNELFPYRWEDYE